MRLSRDGMASVGVRERLALDLEARRRKLAKHEVEVPSLNLLTAALLDSTVLISQAQKKMARKWLNEPVNDQILRLGGKVGGERKKSFVMQKLVENMKHEYNCSKKSELMFRVLAAVEEMDQRLGEDCPLVFDTLTVSDDCYDRVFRIGSNEVKNYIRRVERAAPGAKHLMVNEYGAKYGRRHLHILWILPRLPGFSGGDPNVGRRFALRRNMLGWSGCWPNGYTLAMPLRRGRNDWYGRRGWSWPQERIGKHVVDLPTDGGLTRVVRYVAKYLHKSLHVRGQTLKGERAWRTGMSRNLGLNLLRKKIEEKDQEWLIKATQTVRSCRMSVGQIEIPRKLVKKEAMRSLCSQIPSSKLWREIVAYRPPPSIVKQCAELMKSTRACSSRIVGPLKTMSTISMGVCEMDVFADLDRIRRCSEVLLDTGVAKKVAPQVVLDMRRNVLYNARVVFDDVKEITDGDRRCESVEEKVNVATGASG